MIVLLEKKFQFWLRCYIGCKKGRGGGMADTSDLKSEAHCEREGSNPSLGTKIYINPE
jgi:hypothetical protein